MSDSTLKLRKFDMRWIKDDKVCVFIGRRETGKSFLLKDCLYYHRDIPAGKIICSTEGANGSYGHHIPKIFISEEFQLTKTSIEVKIAITNMFHVYIWIRTIFILFVTNLPRRGTKPRCFTIII